MAQEDVSSLTRSMSTWWWRRWTPAEGQAHFSRVWDDLHSFGVEQARCVLAGVIGPALVKPLTWEEDIA